MTPCPSSGLVSSPACVAGYSCWENCDYGAEDVTKYNIDILLEVVNPLHAKAFVDAKDRWMEVITGDLSSVQSQPFRDPEYNCANALPTLIDDLIICGRDEYIDGPGTNKGNILGAAGPLWLRKAYATGLWTTIVGRMKFDIVDIDRMIADGSWDKVILHEMGHVLGIGSLWSKNNLIGTNLIYQGVNAINVWKNDWNCVTDTPPVETDGGIGTAGGHWDEDCFDSELMTGFRDPDTPMPLSRLTVASLKDSGYTVDYSVADTYDGSNIAPGCCLSTVSQVEGGPTQKPKPPLSPNGRANAIAYGLNILKASELPPSFIAAMEQDGLAYVGDRLIFVLYEENGYTYEVYVTNE